MTRARPLLWVLAAIVPALLPGQALADEVQFLNGDRLTGKIVSAAGGKLRSRPMRRARS